MNNRERALLTRAYSVVNRLGENVPANPMDIAQVGRCQNALDQATMPLGLALLAIRDGDHDFADGYLQDAEMRADLGRRG